MFFVFFKYEGRGRPLVQVAHQVYIQNALKLFLPAPSVENTKNIYPFYASCKTFVMARPKFA